MMRARGTGTRTIAPSRSAIERSFLPAAVEVLESPPPLASRLLLLSIAVLTAAALTWAALGELDQVVVAPGQLVPGGQVKVVQSVHHASVLAIAVRDGQRVRAGELLVELDATQAAADVRRLERLLASARLALRREHAFAAFLRGERPTLEPLPRDAAASLPVDAVRRAREHLDQSMAAHDAAMGELAALHARSRATLASGQAALAKLEAIAPILSEREASLAELLSQGAAARSEWLDARERLLSVRHDRRAERERIRAARQELAASGEKRRGLAAGTRAATAAAIARLRDEVDAAVEALAKAKQRVREHRLRAPVDGTVTALRVHTVGAVVTPAEHLMEIVPDGVPLRLEAMVENKDVGFVQAGQYVEVKVDSFPFTRFGLLTGRVKRLSADAVEDPRAGTAFKLEVMLAERSMRVGERTVALTPGMTVVAEIKTGTRTVLEFLLAPALRAAREAMRER